MRRVIKTANRFETMWTTALMLPAIVVLMNAGIAFYQGQGEQSEVTQAAGVLANNFTNQYTPYVETTGSFIASGVEKVAKALTSCAGGSSAPIYLNPAIKNQGCAFGKGFSPNNNIKPYSP